MNEASIIRKFLLTVGWLLFWLSLFTPVNTSIGGLTDAGKPYYGFLNLFYSIISIFIFPMLIFDHQDTSFALGVIANAGVGICNILMIFAVPFLIYSNTKKNIVKYIAVGCALYICTIGTVVSWHFYPIRYGYYIWCLSFIIVAFAFIVKAKTMNFMKHRASRVK